MDRRLDDEEMARRVVGGDLNAYRWLVERHQAVVFGLARQLVDHAEAEDVAQEAFIRAFHHIERFDPEVATFRTWLLSIARNAGRNRRRRRGARSLGDGDEPRVEVAAGRRLEAEEVFAQLDAALDGLPVEQRAAFVLAELHELSMAEVAAIEGVPVGTIKSRLNRAKEKLRGALSRFVEDPT